MDAAELSVSTPSSKFGFCLRPKNEIGARVCFGHGRGSEYDGLETSAGSFWTRTSVSKKYWICFFKVDCMSFFGQDAKK